MNAFQERNPICFLKVFVNSDNFFNVAGKGQKIYFANNLWGERPLGAH